MSTFVVAIFPDARSAREAVRALDELHDEGRLSRYDTTVVQRQLGGWLEILQQGTTVTVTTGIDLLVAALIGVFGAASAPLVRSDASDEFLEDVSRRLLPGDCAVLAEVSEASTARLDARIQALGGVVLREKRGVHVDGLIEKRAEAFKAEVEEREAARGARDLVEVRDRFARMADRARDRLANTKAEVQRKVAVLEAQARHAKPAVKALLEQRLAEVWKDLAERERRLSRAFELAR